MELDNGADSRIEDVKSLSGGLSSSSTKRRTAALTSLTVRLAQPDVSQHFYNEVIRLLFNTYPYYTDRTSRRAVQKCLQADAFYPPRTSLLVDKYVEECSKQGLAASNALVLVEWGSVLLQHAAKDAERFRGYGMKLVMADAQVLDLCLSTLPKARVSIQKSALLVTRRALRVIVRLGKEDLVAEMILRLTGKGEQLGQKGAAFLGVIAGVCARLPAGRALMERNKEKYYAFYVREILGSRSEVPNHIISAFRDFFFNFITKDDLQREIVPALEKALLRAPELILNGGIIPVLVSQQPSDIDLSDILAGNLLKPLLSNIKSSHLRDGIVAAFRALISHSREESYITKIKEELLGQLARSKVPAEHVPHAQMLEIIPAIPSESVSFCDTLVKLLPKEPSEPAMVREVGALMTQFQALPADAPQSIAQAVADAAVKGLGDKRPSVRRLWMIGLGNVLWSAAGNEDFHKISIQSLVEQTLPGMLAIVAETEANPLLAAQSGLLVGAYVIIALWLHLSKIERQAVKKTVQKTKSPIDQALSIGTKSSYLLNVRLYSKLTSQEDLDWILRALIACSVKLSEKDRDTQNAWAEAFIFLTSASGVAADHRQEAMNTLERAYLSQKPLISKIIIRGLWKWHQDVERDAKDSAAVAAKIGNSRSVLVLRSICPQVKNEKIQSSDDDDTSAFCDQLIDMLVLCRPELIPGAHWIELCLRMGQDPGSIVKSKANECMEKITQILTSDDNSASAAVYTAAYNTAAELAFVCPENIVPLIIERIKIDLPGDKLTSCGPTEIAIARTPEGTAFIDVLSTQKDKFSLDKNSRDYETAKWEAEVRSQLAQKKGQEKKLTADEKAKVNAQLIKEASIRKEVQQLERTLRNGIGIIHALAIGPPTEASQWLGLSLKALVEVIKNGAGHLVGSAADDAYLACSNFLSPRLGFMRRFVGIATLRGLGASNLPDELEQEPLQEIVTRILYRLRFAGEQRNFDSTSLLYILPLLFTVLQKGGLGQCTPDEADEQITLALEFLGFHTNEFSDTALPREELLAILIDCMQKFSQHYKLLKDCISDLCSAITVDVSSTEIGTLLTGVIVSQQSVRSATLQAIREHIDLTSLDFCEEIWLACHDDVEENATLGLAIWEENALETEPTDAIKILSYLESGNRQLRNAASRALAECIGENQVTFEQILDKLQTRYIDLAKPRLPERDAFGMLKKTDIADPWQARSGIALAFKEVSSIFHDSRLVPFVQFMINESAVGDRNSTVRDEMILAASEIIASHGAAKLEELMYMFEAALAKADKDPNSSDLVNEAVVILYGAIARHLPEGDRRVPQVVQRLLLTLSTPSETVQYAVAGCLPPLIQTSIQKTPEYIQSVLDQLLQSKKYAARRGAAYGLAGIVKGKGISALREYRIMSSLRAAGENKKDQNHRQGALFAYELLAFILGQTFEPYIIQIVPQLLSSFGDATADVREACLDASKSCFAHLSSYGVKIILPTLLEGLEESQWRSKKGACDLLGAMAYLDPQQLAASLPDIIPPLTNVLNDSHKEVRAAANRSLQRFGEVISNPEVKSLVSILLKALSDPTKYTDDALDALIKVSFVHYLDSPSLALIVRILQRGLADRSGTKRKSAQIIGSLAHLTERKDVTSHLPILVAGLKLAIVDPVPATRATSSKALGSLVEKLGEEALPDLIPSLMMTLKSETGAGDRLGSAQALSEVLAGLGTVRLEETLPTILQNVASTRPTVREGFMSLFIYLPACFGNSFANYLSKIIPPILAGLADDIESIRETSLRAGRLLVKNFATKAIDLLLPELDRGLADDSYRIRLSSVELVGDLLFNLTGISGTTEQDEEDDGATEAGKSLLEVLGEDKRNKILSSLYICRNDTSGLVRSAAINVWKALVATPRTLKELVPTLTQLLIKRLASPNMEQKVIAGNALGELIRKAGENVLSSLLPTLEDGLQNSTDTDTKQGICIALREIISSASEEALEDYEKTLISVVRIALVDSNPEVREAAAEAFDSLQQILGKKAVDQVLPYLLNLLRTESEADTALSALLTLLTDSTRSNIILPNLVPTLLVSPISSFNAKAIASLSQVAGPAMNRRLPAILNALMDNLVACTDDSLRSELEDAFDMIMVSIDEFDGLNTAMSVMLTMVKHNDHKRRAAADLRLSNFFARTEVDFARYHQDLIRVLLISFDDSDSDVVKAAWLALSELTKCLKKEEMESLVFSTRTILQQVGTPGANLPGFTLPKGISAILPIFLQGLMNGTADQRTHAALAISDIIDRSSGDSLKPFVTHITGPLIRVVSERSVDVKAAILFTLNHLLEKIPTFLKPFLPQLQRTFAKSLADPSSEVLRTRAAKALGTLITLTPRIDPLITELVTGSKTSDAGVQNAMLRALYEVVSKAGGNMSEASRTSILALIDTDPSNLDETMTITYARLFGALIKSLPDGGSVSSLLKSRVLTTHMSNASVLNLNSVLLESPASLTENFAQETPTIICHGIRSKNTFVSDNSILAAGKYLLLDSPQRSTATAPIIEALANAIQPGGPVDTRRLALVVIRTVSRSQPEQISPHLKILTPPIFASVRDPVIPVKLAAEAAFLAIFSVVDSESEIFDNYIAQEGNAINPSVKRSMQDYFKRVAVRLGNQARERKEAEGGQGGLGLSNDEREDEREIWSVGKVDLGEKAIGDE